MVILMSGGVTLAKNPVAGVHGHAVIGDELRLPAVWCEFGAFIDRYTHPEALGLADVRARAIADGWRQDALGRYACPSCLQQDTAFRATGPLVPWEPSVLPPIRRAEPAVAGWGPVQDDLARPAEGLPPLPEEPPAVSRWDSSPLAALRLAGPPAEADHRRLRLREAGRHRLTA